MFIDYEFTQDSSFRVSSVAHRTLCHLHIQMITNNLTSGHKVTRRIAKSVEHMESGSRADFADLAGHQCVAVVSAIVGEEKEGMSQRDIVMIIVGGVVLFVVTMVMCLLFFGEKGDSKAGPGGAEQDE